METVNHPNQTIKIVNILKQSLSLYKKNFLLFIGIALLGNVFGFVDVLVGLVSQAVRNWLSLIMGPLGIFVSIWASIALIIAASNRYTDTKITLKECFANTKGRYWRFIGINVLYFLILGLGLLLFVIPGIYWGTIFSLSVVIVVLEKRRDIGPFKLSKELIRGSFFKVLMLGLIVTALSLPLYFILFRLMKVNQNLGMITSQIYNIFYISVVTIVDVVLYHRLKEIRGDELPISPEGEVKKRKGCLGCLIATGLAVLIIILSVFWISGLVKYFNTDKGTQVLESIKKKISPQIIFPGGVTLERPEGAFVMKKEVPNLEYTIFLFHKEKDKTASLRLYAYSLEDLNLATEHVEIGDGKIAKALRYERLDKNEFVKKTWEKSYGVFKALPIKTVNINNRLWGEYVLDARKEMPSGKVKGYQWKIYYTPVSDYMLVTDFGYKYDINAISETYKPDTKAINQEENLKELLGAIRFPE